MAPYDDWNKIEDEEEDELQDASFFEGRRDVILFAIDASESMQALREDPVYEDAQTCHLLTALEAAIEIQKKKVIVGPNDSVGIVIFNTTMRSETTSRRSEIKRGSCIFQDIGPISAPKIQDIIRLVEEARENPEALRDAFPPVEGKNVPMGDVFISCNWVLRDGAPKTATKRVFLITDEDDPHREYANTPQLMTSAQTTLSDLMQAGASVEPFFISTEDRAFDSTKFYSSVLPAYAEDDDDEADSSLPPSMSITRIEDLLAQMRFHEVPKRSIGSLPFEIAPGIGFKIGVKVFGLITEQKKGAYKYFMDLGDRMQVVDVKTAYIDEDRQAEVSKGQIMYGPSLGATAANAGDRSDDEEDETSLGVRSVKAGGRPFYTAEEIKSFRTLGLEPVIRLLGFKDRSELAFEDNIKHSSFIYPDEMPFAGSKRTFTALLKSMVAKDKIALVLALMRRNSTPYFCALLPQLEAVDDAGWTDPAGFHLIPLPFADDIRAAPIDEAHQATGEMKDSARAFIDKLSIKNGAYPPDFYPNPALAYHNAQLEASAFREEWDPDTFEDLTLPKYDMIHKRAGGLIQEWKSVIEHSDLANVFVSKPTKVGTKRKADVSVDEAEIRAKWEDGTLTKLRNDQLKDFLKSKSESVSGKKADLVERVAEWMQKHG